MLKLTGTFSNYFYKAAQINKDTGEVTPRKLYGQVLSKNWKPDNPDHPEDKGEYVLELQDVKLDSNIEEKYLVGIRNKEVEIKISLFTPRNNQVIYFSCPLGEKPLLIQEVKTPEPNNLGVTHGSKKP